MFEAAVGESRSTTPKWKVGDIVVHPTKEWPWLGVVQGSGLSMLIRCTYCGQPKPHTFAHHQTTFDQVACEDDYFQSSEEIDEIETAADIHESTGLGCAATQLCQCEWNGGDATETTAESCPCCNVNSPQEGAAADTKWEMKCESTVEKPTRWQIVWHPTLEVTEADGTEIVIGSTARRFFQDGQSLERINNSSKRRGIAKRVVQLIDALVLPDCKRVITGLSSADVKAVRTIEQHAGIFVIYKGWLGAVYGVSNIVRFRMNDGTEFTLADADREMTVHFSESMAVKRHAPVDSSQMYPGMKVNAPYVVLETAAEWADPSQPSDSLKQKIAASRKANDLKSAKLDEIRWTCAEGKSSPSVFTNGESLSDNSTSASAKKASVKADKVELTVVSVTTQKIDVEWRCQVAGIDYQEPSSTVIEGDELNKIKLFRVPLSYLQHKGMGSRSRHEMAENDRLIAIDRWRQQLKTPKTEGASAPFTNGAADSPAVRVGDEVYLYQLTSSTRIDVLWEDGSMEYDVDGDELTFSQCSDASRDYFPAMYVQLEPRAIDGDSARDASKDKFGLIKSCSNAEKFAKIQWFRSAPPDAADRQPEVLETVDMSFYDLRSHPDFNYLTGTLVARLNPSLAPSLDKPNVGYVVQKRYDGKVLVRWFGEDKDNVENPWELYKLRVDGRYGDADSIYSDMSGAEGAPHQDGYYSPTEHEWDDLEDLRYFDYSKMDEMDRWRRVGLLAELLSPVLALLHQALLTAANELPMLERRQLVRFCLHCEDVIAGFAQLDRFKEPMRRFYTEELGIVLPAEEKKKNNSLYLHQPDHTTPDDEQVLWSMSTWMYDWLEVTAELQQAVNKHKAKMSKQKEKQQQEGAGEGGVATATARKTPSDAMDESGDGAPNARSTAPHRDPSPLIEEPMEESVADSAADSYPPHDPHGALASIQEWSHLVQTAFTTTAQILAHGQTVELTAPLVFDCIQNIRKHIKDTSPNGVANAPSADQVRTAFRFMKTFQTNGKKLGRLPCFSYSLPPESDLRLLAEEWRLFPMHEKNQPRAIHSAAGALSSDETLANLTRKSTARLEAFDDAKKGLNFAPEDVVPMIQEVADALTLATVTVLRSLLELVRNELYEQHSKPLLVEQEVRAAAAQDASCADGDERVGDDGEDDKMSASTAAGDSKDAMDDFGAVLSPGSFEMIESAPNQHRFIGKSFDISSVPKTFATSARKELRMLQSSLPEGIMVKAFENRMDLFTCMIVGPDETPYAHGLFLFDVRLKEDYPMRPPHVFFKSMAKRLNPNLYEDGMVCLSLLGTWDGKETELWTSSSTLLQVFLSIQSLVLVPEPYYLEPGYEKERGTESGKLKSREYNESAILLTLESLQRIVMKPPEPFERQIRDHFLQNAPRLLSLLDRYQNEPERLPYPLAPVTQGFCLCVRRYQEAMKRLYDKMTAEQST
uniref:UBC core domain-containing protein n=1 Tax=Plectus sambesii TaxID=2011161 RepID=A0A914WH57_9BILA